MCRTEFSKSPVRYSYFSNQRGSGEKIELLKPAKVSHFCFSTSASYMWPDSFDTGLCSAAFFFFSKENDNNSTDP